MHKHITLSGDAEWIQKISKDILKMDDVVGVSHQRGASLKPKGDLLSIHVLNQAADEVMNAAAPGIRQGLISAVIAESKAIVDKSNDKKLALDDDEGLWEEMESQLRNHGRISPNYLILMALGGLIAAIAFAGDPVSQAIAFVGASIIAPGFEPISKMSLGIVLKRWPLIRGGGIAMLGGYATLIAAAFMGFKFLDYFHITTIDEIRALPIMETLTGASKDSLVHSICAAVAGTLVITSLRDTYVVGPLIVLVMIPSSALTGIALGAGDFALAAEAFARVAIDVGLIIGAGCLVYLWKQIAKHRREPLP